MLRSNIKKMCAVAALSAASVLLLTGSAAATSQERWDAAQQGVQYLSASQPLGGSFACPSTVTNWSAVAAAAAGEDLSVFQTGGASLLDALLADPLTGACPATDIERRILEISAAGQDASDFGGVNYADLLLGYFNNGQIGEPTLLNDDIFGILALAALGHPDLYDEAQQSLDYLLLNREADGGFSFTTLTDAECGFYCGSDNDDTAAAIVALKAAADIGLTNADLETALEEALQYLLVNTRQADGGFIFASVFGGPSSGSSTAWALMALNAVGDSVAAEAAAAQDWLVAHQGDDGNFEVFGFDYTPEAVLALLGTTWLLQPEPMQAPPAPQPEPTPNLVTYSTPSQVAVANTTIAHHDTDEAAEVLSEQAPVDDTQKNVPNDSQEKAAEPVSEKDDSNNTTWFVLAGFIVVAILWFVIQSKSKQKKS
jgi:hypothetical protein